MKNTFFFAAALLFATATVQAQSTRDSIAAKYKLLPMPEALTLQKSFPVIGTYQLSGTENAGTVSIALDSANKGIVWISGLPQGTFKAYLKKAPGTYRILSQKTSAGKQIPEGTLVFDQETSTLNVALGAYNEADPAAIFAGQAAVSATPADVETKVKVKTAKTKTKAKVTFYTATKVDAANTAGTQAATAPADQK
ncbi:MAG: hypothetical protein JWP27_1754 [Flaviaesturariibacter sp.]|nr:hypothetical protein [Flaviaesturariibacter sp.]